MKKKITILLTKDEWSSVVNSIAKNGSIEEQEENISLVFVPNETKQWPLKETTAFMTALARALLSNQTITSLQLGRFLKTPEENERETLQRDFKNVFEKNKTLTALKLFGPGCSMIILNALKDVLAIPNVNTSVAIREIGLGAFTTDNTSLNIPAIADVLNALPHLAALTLNNLKLDVLLTHLTERALASLQTLKLPYSELTKPLLDLFKKKFSQNSANLRFIESNFSGNDAALELFNILSPQKNLETISLARGIAKKNISPIKLTPLLSAIEKFPKIQQVIFKNCLFDKEKTVTLSNSLQGKTTLEKLILDNSDGYGGFDGVQLFTDESVNFILKPVAQNHWPQLTYLKLYPCESYDHAVFLSLSALLEQNAIIALYFESRIISSESINTIAKLLEIISRNQRLEILHLPKQNISSAPEFPSFPDKKLFYPALHRCLEYNESLRVVRVPLSEEKILPEFSRVMAKQAFITTLHLNCFDFEGNQERPKVLTQAMLQNNHLENVWFSTALWDPRPWSEGDAKLERHLQQNQQNRQNRLSNIAFFIGVLSALASQQSRTGLFSPWDCIPLDIRALIWQFWQLEFPMGKTLQQIGACLKFFDFPETASAANQLIKLKPQEPLRLFEHRSLNNQQQEYQFALQTKKTEFISTSARIPGLRIIL